MSAGVEFFNRINMLLLKSPLHGLASFRLMLITVTGLKTGNQYTTPVEYHREGDVVTVVSQRHRTWWRNLRGGAAVDLHLKGKTLRGFATVNEHNQETITENLLRLFKMLTREQAETMAQNMVLITITLQPTPQPA
jgi:deazaflavin-dependent oxidoreductase (nitroreductase family)